MFVDFVSFNFTKFIYLGFSTYEIMSFAPTLYFNTVL